MSAPLIRPAVEADVPQILALERSVAEAPHWSEASYRAFLPSDSSAAQHRALLVALHVGELQGFAAASALGSEAELESIVVSAASRGRHVGTHLLQAVSTWARAGGAQHLLLEVRSLNVAARSFYRTQGFEERGVRPKYYTAPADDAVQLRLGL